MNPIEISGAVIVVAEEESTSKIPYYSRILSGEIAVRTGLAINPTGYQPGLTITLDTAAEGCGTEGYHIYTRELPDGFQIGISGSDERGVLYGIGKLLRSIDMRKGAVFIPADLEEKSAPRFSIRGHQIGYRALSNSYDGWSIEQFETYVQELAYFGTNCIELIPPCAADPLASPNMKYNPANMMAMMSGVLDTIGLDVSIWYPNLFETIKDRSVFEEELTRRDNLFAALPRIDQVMIPGGDPGKLSPSDLFAWGNSVAKTLRIHHPNAKVWISPQAFDPDENWVDDFFRGAEQASEWLTGLVFGPWVPMGIKELTKRTQYPIRFYPDISHSLNCQFPVPDWDTALALTHGREGCNPRPKGMKIIHNHHAPYIVGSITYSEGIHDDVNKFIWSGLDWNPNASPGQILEEYCRLLISPELSRELAEGFAGLEENWQGSLAQNKGVEKNLDLWLNIETSLGNRHPPYRFEMGLLRACFDAYTRQRLIGSRNSEMAAIGCLRSPENASPAEGAEKAIEYLESKPGRNSRILGKCIDLSEKLHGKVGWKTSVSRYGAFNWRRGAFMDSIDVPVDNSPWFLRKLRHIVPMDEYDAEVEKKALLSRIEPPPPMRRYNLGDGGKDSIVQGLSPKAWEQDPGFVNSPFREFASNGLQSRSEYSTTAAKQAVPESWMCGVAVLYQTPLVLIVPDLKSDETYEIAVVYFSHRSLTRARLIAGSGFLIDDDITIQNSLTTPDYRPVRFYQVPPQIVENETLKLTWQAMVGTKVFCISELWVYPAGMSAEAKLIIDF
jgi:hypothetical protein